MTKPRLSLSAAERATACGAELLVLCQSVTLDGALSDHEIIALHDWLAANANAPLPAIAFLRDTVHRIIADRRVTREERDELYRAIETVLPPEARREAKASRRILERAEEERVRPLMRLNFMVTGIWYEGREAIIRQYVNESDAVFLVRDPANPYSPNAVEVRLQNGYQIGYVPEEDAVEAARLLDQGCPFTAHVTRILREARMPIPIVKAQIHRVDSGLPGLFLPINVTGRTIGVTSSVPSIVAAAPPTVRVVHKPPIISVRAVPRVQRVRKQWWEFWK